MAIGWQACSLFHSCLRVCVRVLVHEYKTLFLFIPFFFTAIPPNEGERGEWGQRHASSRRTAHIKQNLLENISFSFGLAVSLSHKGSFLPSFLSAIFPYLPFVSSLATSSSTLLFACLFAIVVVIVFIVTVPLLAPPLPPQLLSKKLGQG